MKRGLDKFQESLSRQARKVTDTILNSHGDEFLEVFRNYLANSEGPKYLQRNLSREEIFLTKLLYLFAEIPRIY